MSRRERRAAAKGSRTAPKAATANTPLALHEAGLAHFHAGRFLDAQLCCQKALALDAEYADALHLMGCVSISAGQHDHAVEWISRALRQDPRPEYLASLGTALQRQERYEDALKAVDKALQIKPDDAELWRQLGDILVQLSHIDHALLSYQHVLKLDPAHQDALYKTGALLHQSGRYAEAITHLDRAREVLPDHAPTLQTRARALHNLNRLEEALADGKRAHQLEPGNADTCNNLGAALRLLDRNEEAQEWFDKALKIEPNLVIALNNKLASLFRLQRFDEMFAIHGRMKSLGLSTTETEWNVSLAHLITGNFEAGWPGHGARLQLPAALYPKFKQPMWLGEENIEGKTVFVCSDEGLGDTIQFVRYVPWLAERGARVILAVQDPLLELLRDVRGVSECIPVSSLTKIPDFELHCPISSLPLAFGTRLHTIPSAASYLPPLATSRVQAWEERLGGHSRLRVGLVWSGSTAHSNDRHRSIPLRMFLGLLDVDATFVSLQKEPRPNDAAVLRERSDIVDLTAHLTDFTETAALVSCLDLVITVDTSVAHLSAALGRPTWILLPYTPDYRWLLDRDDSPWYPSVRLFRQTASWEYASVLDRVRTELERMTSQPYRTV